MPAQRAVALRRLAGRVGFAGLVGLACGCAPTSLQERWTCDFDATEGRPLTDPDASSDDAGSLPPSTCAETCGPPATRCRRTLLDGALPGAICPVCTF